MKKLVILFSVAVFAQIGFGKTVGVHQDDRSLVTVGLLKTIQEAGWQTVMLDNKALADETKLAGVDVLLLTGGWNEYWFPEFQGRRSLIKFVAGGKGILSSGFRSGYSRTANRPLFPQVGATFNRVNGSFITGSGDSELAKAIDHPFSPGGWDHMAVKVGPEGEVFAVTGGDAVGVYGEPYGGRYVAFGAFLGGNAISNALTGPERQVVLKTLEWLASAPKLSEAEKAKFQALADLDFLRREKLLDWTLNERGPDVGSGIIPNLRKPLVIPLESRQFTLEYMSQYLSGKQQDACRAAADELKKAVAELNDNFQKAIADRTAQINKMTLAELTDDNSWLNKTNLIARIDAAVGKTDVEKKKIKASITNDNRTNEKMVATFLYGDEWAAKIMSSQKVKELAGRGDKAIAEFRPAVAAAKAAKLAKEHQQDLAAVPEWIVKCASADTTERQEAVLELGRIGDLRAAKTLIGALDDQDEKVRINAILGLGWMQAKDGVPALIKLAEGSDVFMKRRAVQALGQIGDPRATKVLLACITDSDYVARENAIFALGWLKAKDAVPELLNIVTSVDKNADPWLKNLLVRASISALGNIGDVAAIPALEKIYGTNVVAALTKTPGEEVAKFIPSQDETDLKKFAGMAIVAIHAGGNSRPGIEQPSFLASKDHFYALTKQFNALAGRPFDVLGPVFHDDYPALLPYLKDAGLTGIHNGWGDGDRDNVPAKHFEMIKAAGDLDLLWIDILPNAWNSALEKDAWEATFKSYQDVPAFAGFWSEEWYPPQKLRKGEFAAWFKAKYGEDPRKKYGLSDDAVIPTESGLLKTEYLQCCGERMLASWKEAQEWMHGMRKGCSFTFSISHRLFATYIGPTGMAGDVIDVSGPESYQSFGRDNAFMMEMQKNGQARPVMCEYYNWYTPSSAQAIRGYAQHLMHGECFFNFDLEQVFPFATNYNWLWDPARWDNMRAIFQKAERIKEYLNVPASAANVAQLCSEASACHYQDSKDSLGSRWYQHQAALWTALQQSQIPADVIWTETLTPAKLARYRVIVMADAKILTDAQAGLIRDWVKQGGVLIAGGSSSLFDFLPAVKKNYGLSDVFGVQYAGFAGVSDPVKNDTLNYWEGKPPLPVESSMALPAVRRHIHREFKPVKSIGVYKVAGSPALPGMEAGAACEYDMPLGYDKVKPVSAEILASFANGDAAVTLNKVGKGLCYFWTPIYPGLCYVGSGFENDANVKDFWQNSREVLAAMIKGGLAQQQATLPVDVTGVSTAIEVTVRQQPEHNRWMVHLLDYDTKTVSVKGPLLTVHPPAGKTVKRIFYPDTDTGVKFSVTDAGVTAPLREFEVHDMVVIEWADKFIVNK